MGTEVSHRQSLRLHALWLTLGITVVCFSGLSARSLYKPKSVSGSQTSSKALVEPVVRVHRAGSFELAIPHNGTVGFGFSVSIEDPEGGIIPSFQFPQDSNLEYLYGGALWIGAIAGEDTLVSVGADGWIISDDMTPSSVLPGVRIVSGLADENLETHYIASSQMGVTIRQRSMAWNREPNNDFAVIEYHITNSLNPDTLKDVYIGLYIDADILHTSETNGHIDDIAGFLPEQRIAYIADNDGHPTGVSDSVWTEKSARAVLGAKILDIKYTGAGTLNPPSFNWWISNGAPERDFGPRLIGTADDPFRDFGGFLGTPFGSLNKYYMLSHAEEDYDQLETALDHSADGWLPPIDSGLAVDLARGSDARFLISQGGISLAPGDSMIFVVAIGIGDGIHVDPTDFADSFDPLNPDVFYNKLDFMDLKRNIEAAESLYVSGYDVQIVAPPPKPTLDDILSAEPLMNWIFSANPSVESYDIYLAKAPDSSVLCHYALIDTPQIVPENIIATVTTDTFRLTNLEDGAWYAAAVAIHPRPDSTALISKPVVFQYGIPHRPTWDNAMFLNEDQLMYRYVSSGPEISLRWNTEDSDIDHFNLYRRPDSMFHFDPINFVRVTHPGPSECFIFPGGGGEVICSKVINDSETVCLFSIVPRTRVPGDVLSFTESPGAPSKHIYGISAVDSAGNESAMLGFVFGYTAPSDRNKTALILNDSTGTTNVSAPVSRDMYLFYRNLLAPYEPDYLVRKTRRFVENEWPPKYSTIAKYKTVIVDGSSRTGLLHGNSVVSWAGGNWLVDYVRSGGTVLDVGTNFATNQSHENPPQLVRTWYAPPRLGNILLGRDIFGLDSIIMVPAPTRRVELDSVNQFYRPAGAMAAPGNGFPDLTYHHSGFFVDPPELTEGPIPFKGVMFPRAENTEVLYTWVSGRDTASNFEGLPIGVKYTPVTHTAYVLISSPWEWEPEQAQDFLAKILGDFQTGIADDEAPTLPRVFALSQNFPNPFNPSTQISYSVPRRSQVTLSIYNILGQKVRTLVNEVKEAGEHIVTWDAGKYASGMYFYRLSAGETRLSRKMILLK